MPLLELLLPIGLSFHTFQAMSYTIEVYQGKQPAERHLGIYALYVMFYPQLVAGPIERPQHLIHQFKVKHVFDYENAANGLRQMVWGLYKKSVIADNIAAVIDPVFVYPQRYSATVLAISACFFMFQLYCDFSGYSDIAIGCARVMGFRLMVNFNHPFRARSVADYWRRWHISLTTWFRDYVFIPLGGNKVGSARLIINLMLVFVLSGFWHGASWNFLIWGGINGLLYILSAFITGKLRLKGHSTIMARLSQVGTFSLIVLNHIYFRSKDLGDANYIFSKIFTAGSEWVQAIQKPSLWSELVFNHFSIIKSLICFCLILLLELVHHLEGEGHIFELIARKKLWVRWGVYIFVFTQIYMSGVFNSRQFLYFQF